MNKIKNYFSLVKFSHTIFAMPFALLGYFLAIFKDNYSFRWQVLLFIILCMIFARNAAMAFNRYLDSDIDKKNKRTSSREIPAGKITKKSALFFVMINSILFCLTTYFLNTTVLWLSPVALLVILAYSYTKRFTVLCHLVLGLGLSLAPIGAYLAVTAHFDITPVLYSLSVLFWVSGFDIIYSLQDIDFDQKERLHSIPVALGKQRSLFLAKILHTFSIMTIVGAGMINRFQFFYWLGASIFTIMLIFQHQLVKPNDLSRINLAFFTTNGIASILFASFSILSFVVQYNCFC